ncbi:MAG: T9SS type A sorting domain-containing protein [Cyclobacteriaceae bacterium]
MKKIFIILILVKLSILSTYGQFNWRIDTLHNPIPLQNGNEYGGVLKLSADGTTLAVGAKKHDGWTGFVEVFRRDPEDGTSWERIGQTIIGPEGGRFGSALDISEDGNRIVVGAPSPGGLSHNGYFQVYDYHEGTNQWEPIVVNSINEESVLDATGWAVAMTADGTRIAIGSPYIEVNGSALAGEVNIYDLDMASDSFIHSETLHPIGEIQEGMRFGTTISMTLDGSVIVVSAPYFDTITDQNAGRIYAYKTNDGINYVNAGLKTGGGYFGESIAIEKVNGEPVMVVGRADSRLEMYVGVANPFWSAQVPEVINGTMGSSLGRSVDINSSGDIIAGLLPTSSSPPGIGAVKFFELDGAYSWQEAGTIEPLGTMIAENLGKSVSISEQIFTCGAFYLAAGAPNINEYSPPPLEMQPYVILEMNKVCYNSLPPSKLTSEEVIIHPNPVKNGFLTVESVAGSCLVTVVNTRNKEILRKTVNYPEEPQLDLTDLCSGIYYLKVYDGSKKLITTKRVVVE